MKKKTFYPISLLMYIPLTLFLSFIFLSIYALVMTILELDFSWYKCLAIIAELIVIILFSIIFLATVKKKIVFHQNEINVKADWTDKKGALLRRLQHEVHITYKEIENIYMIITNHDSLNNHVKNVFVAMPYIVFSCKGGQQKMINVYFYNKRQIAKIIDEIKLRTEACDNALEISSGKEFLADFLQDIKCKKRNDF